jgi:two-component system sensor histidine kinase MprB
VEIRRRITILTAACVGLAVLVACIAAYVAVHSELYGQVDDQLRGSSFAGAGAGGRPPLDPGLRDVPADVRREFLQRLRDPPPRRGGPPAYVQFVSATGKVRALRGDLRLPLDDATRRIAAAGSGSTAPRTVDAGGTHVRMVSFAAPGVGAVQVGRSLEGTDRVLSRLRLVLAFVLLAGVGLAVFLARRVGGRFSGVLGDLKRTNAALDSSLTAQRQLVADASHELRTPVTSLRTNVEVLLDGGELDPESRQRLLDDVREQTEELSALVGDVIELARGDAQNAEPQDLRIDELAREAVTRARRHAPADVEITLRTEPATLAGVPERLGRAINNLLDNAVRHAPPGTVVEVGAGPDGVSVRDHGPGVDPDDAPHLFDRFYRGVQARGEQGTGLGLAIVRQVAEAHGGGVAVANAAGGGAEFRLVLPGRAVSVPVSQDL